MGRSRSRPPELVRPDHRKSCGAPRLGSAAALGTFTLYYVPSDGLEIAAEDLTIARYDDTDVPTLSDGTR